MDFLNKIFSLFDKADNAMYRADRMQYTVDRMGNQTKNVTGSGKFKKLIYILIIVVVILYFVFGN